MNTTERMIQAEERANVGQLTEEDKKFTHRIRQEFPAGSDLHTRAGRLLVMIGAKLPE